MGVELVSVTVDGAAFNQWEEIDISGSKSEAAWSFSMRVAMANWKTVGRQKLKSGAKVEIKSNGDLLIAATIEQRRGRLGPEEDDVTISGRTAARNAIDSSHEHPTHQVKNKTLLDFAKEIDTAKVGFVAKAQAVAKMAKRDFHLNAGATIFHEVERFSRTLGLTLMGRRDGKIEIATAGDERHGDLVEGGNIKSIDFDHNDSNRHGKYRVIGQRKAGAGALNHEVEAVARDAGVTDPRTAVIVVEHDIDQRQAKSRAENRRDQAAGQALKATVEVQGFRDSKGALWSPNRRVYVDSPTADLQQDMLVEDVTMRIDNHGGSLTRMALVDPRAHGGKASGRNKSGAGWKASFKPATPVMPAVTGGSAAP